MKKRAIIPLVAAATLGAGAAAIVPAMASEAEATAVIATFNASGMSFSARLTDAKAIESARANLAGTEVFRTHPHGTIVYTASADNPGWSWHLEKTKMAEASAEVCDGTPQDVENHAITSDSFCPWNGRVTALRDA